MTLVSLDEDSGEMLPQVSTSIHRKVLAHLEDLPLSRFDWTTRAFQWASSELDEIIRNPTKVQKRIHEKLNPRKSRELDVRCLSWLSKQPGRNAREKIGGQKQILSVTRPKTLDTHENRIVARLFREIAPEIDRLVDQSARCLRKNYLRQMKQVIDRFLSSELSECVSAFDLRVNNVLLGDRRYAKAWKLLQILNSHRARQKQTWEQGPRNLREAIALTVSSRFNEICVWNEASWRLIEADINKSEQRKSKLAGDDSWICQASDRRYFHFRLKLAPECIQIEKTLMELRSSSALVALETSHINLHADFSYQDEEFLGNEMRFQCLLEVGEQLLTSPHFVGGAGLKECGLWLLQTQDLEPEKGSQGIRYSLSQDIFERNKHTPLLGLDISQLHAVEASPNTVQLTPPLVASLTDLGDWGTKWLSGPELCNLSTGENSRAFFLDDLLSRDNKFEDQDRTAAREIFKSLLPAEKASGSSIAIAIPDHFDEIDFQKIRSSLPSYLRKSTFVWRSVACALAFRKQIKDENKVELKNDDCVVLIDSGAEQLNATFLRLRSENIKGTNPDPWYWERPTQFPALSNAAHCTDKEWLVHRCEDAVRDSLNTNDIDNGYIDELLKLGISDSTETAWMKAANGSLAFDVVRFSETHSSKADEKINEKLQDWIEMWLDSAQCRYIKAQSKAIRIKFVLFGRIFERTDIVELAANMISSGFGIPNASIIAMNSKVAAQGAFEYLDRSQAGLPTWVDLIPELFIKPTNSPTRIQLFQKQFVKPGEFVEQESDQAFELPPNQSAYLLALQRDDHAAPMNYVARIDCKEHFPLASSIPVKTLVSYRHAEDSFRVKLVPQSPQPFRYLEATWARTNPSEKVSNEIENEPPQFPSSIPWNSVTADETKKFDESSSRIVECFDLAFSTSSRDEVQAKRYNKFKGELRKLLDSISSADKLAKSIWVSNRDESCALGPLSKTVERITPYLVAMFAKTLPLQPQKKKKRNQPDAKRINKTFLSTTDTEIQKILGELGEISIRLISRLRCDIHESVERGLHQSADSIGSLPNSMMHAIGRTLNPERETTSKILGSLCRIMKEVNPKQLANIKIALWVLNTGFWTREKLIYKISSEQAHQLVESVEEIFEHLNSDWNKEGAAGELFSEANALILALSRLRGHEGIEDALDAGSKRMRALADSIESLAGFFREQGRTVKSRFAPANGNDLQQAEGIAAMTIATLRGERVAHIRVLEDK